MGACPRPLSGPPLTPQSRPVRDPVSLRGSASSRAFGERVKDSGQPPRFASEWAADHLRTVSRGATPSGVPVRVKTNRQPQEA